MTWLHDRALQILGVLCLSGQGILVFAGAAGHRVPDLAWPGLFLLLTLVLAVVLALAVRRESRSWTRGRNRGALLNGGILVLAVSCLLVVGLGLLVSGFGPDAGRTAGGEEDDPLRLDKVRGILSGFPAAEAVILEEITAAAEELPDSGGKGTLFRFLERWPRRWRQVFPEAASFPLDLVIWQEGLPVAWTGGAEPLSVVGLPQATGSPVRIFRQQGDSFYIRTLVSLGDSLLVELQVPVPGGDGRGSRVRFRVLPVDDLPPVSDGRAEAVSATVLTDTQNRLALLPERIPEDIQVRREMNRSRLMLVGGMAWLVTLAGTWRLFFGWPGFLAGLWLGRGLLAAVDYFRWSGPAFPGLDDPGAPGHLISLVGPAYFATPFAWGWFASTADALLTTLVVALTAWALLRSWGLVGSAGDDRAADGPFRPGLGQGPVSGLVFGLAAVVILLALRSFAALVTENANPRLIGQGITLSFLSFWGLHVVLMLISFALTALLTSWAGSRPWPARKELGPWLGGGALACLVTAGIILVAGDHGRGLPYLGGFLAGAFWLIAPAFRSRPRFLRRFAWPVVLLLTVVWNYYALREVYDRAERGWLESKGQLITGSGEDWTRFLLEDALLGMRDQDQGFSPVGDAAGIWRDRAAYRLWRASALGDLGYSCLVEIIDEEGREESLFATGFMRDFQYEIVHRDLWTDREGVPVERDQELIFQTERRAYPDGQEEILAAEIVRSNGRGWIRVELPLRSWRISTLLSRLAGSPAAEGGYQPRSEVDRPVLLLRGDDTGWLGTGDPGFTGKSTAALVKELKQGTRQWALLRQGDDRWLCRWNRLPDNAARTPGEGFLLGLRQPSPVDNILDLSRIMLLDLTLLFVLFLTVQTWYRLTRSLLAGTDRAGNTPRKSWLPGFQEKFLAGYLLLGLLLLLVVGMSVDRVGYDRVRAEARSQTRQGLSLAVAQLRSLMVEQARSLASSEYIADLLVGQLAGQRPAGPLGLRQGMVFGGDESLLLDETLSDLSTGEGRQLLQAGRNNPLVVIQDDGEIFVATVIPIDLGDVLVAAADTSAAGRGHGQADSQGFFLYRQRFDQDLLGGLADLAQGQATLLLDGQPILASHPGPIFSGQESLFAGPRMMASLLDHPGGPGVFAQPGRPFAFTGSQPLPSFGRDARGKLVSRPIPAVLALAFPDRERDFSGQRRETVLFLAGLANLILLTALALALLMSWNLFRPLRLLLTATRRLALGDFAAPLPEAGGDEVGRLTEAFGRMRSQLQTARDKLAAREQFLTTVLDEVPVGVAVLDSQDKVVALNPAGRHILTDFLPRHDEEQGARLLLAEFREMARGNPTWGGELRSADGRHTLRGALAPLELPDGRVDSMLVFEDVTEFLLTKKMAINAELARQVAHEIKNPLTPIQLSVQLLAQAWRDKHPQLDQIVADTVTRVLDQVELLRSIASEFSLLGRPGELDLQPLDLVRVAAQVVDAYAGGHADTQEGARMNVARQELPEVLADLDSLQKILGNLMQNSLDAARPDEPLAVAVTWEVSPRSVTLVWTDNGQGLAPEVAEKLFDPYFSTKSKGTGLGLAICRNLADRMGGSITLVNRTDGQGTRAKLTLPRSGDVPSQQGEQP